MAITKTFSDIRTDFRRNPVTGDVDLFYDEDAIANSIKNLVFFNKNDVVFTPGLGAGIESYLFEPLSPITASSIKSRITESINNSEPRVEQVTVDVNTLREENGYLVTVSYLPKKSITNVSLKFFLNRVV